MKKMLLMTAFLAVISGCGEDSVVPDTPQPSEPEKIEITKGNFAEGADISWVTQMEQDGVRFYNAAGKQTECTALMKEIGFDAIRLRVWVNPEDGWCGKDDVLVKAKRAQDLGMRLMIDFHYSDSWADPSKQNPPAAWGSFDAAQMTTALEKHTGEVLQLLKDNGVEVEWVQIGNEVNSGMLWPLGKVQDRTAENFVTFLNSGYQVVKKIYPAAKVTVHISNGHEAATFDWFFNLMKLNNAKYDLIGMSLYPAWWENGGWNNWKTSVDKCIANIRSLISKYGKPVIICETGMPVSEPAMSRQALQYILDETRKIEECHGIFCWEPQTDGKWKPSSYSALGWNAYDKGAFKDGKPTEALDPFKDQISR